MAKQQQDSIKLRLTAEQRKQLEQALGRSAEVLELTIEELEERIAPGPTW